MVSHSSEQLPSETEGRTPNVLYLIEIDPNLTPSSIGDGLPLQVLNINQNNTHYLIPIEGSKQTEIPKNVHHKGTNVTTNDSSSPNYLIKDQQIKSKIEADIQSEEERPVLGYVHVPDSKPPPRAVASLPRALRVCRGGVTPLKLLPPRLRFGPIQGVVREVSRESALNLISNAADNDTPVLLKSKNGTISHIDISDKDKSNWFSLLPLGDESTANVWLYQEDDELYGITKSSIAPRVKLCLGYSKQYAEQHRLPADQPISAIDDEEEQRKWWCYECRFACKTAALLQRHMDDCHAGFKSTSRKRRYRCKNCSLLFSRLFTLRRHMLLHCKSNISKYDPPPEPEAKPDAFFNTTPPEEDRLPSDESFQNYTNSLDFSTNLFDTDRLSTLDISSNSRPELNFYGEKDDNYILSGQPESNGDTVENEPSVPNHDGSEDSQKMNAANVMTCPHCQDTMSVALKNRHMRECRALMSRCACGKAFRSRSRLHKHVYAEHANTPPDKGTPGETDSSNYKCDQCQLRFKRRGMFVNHMWRVHGVAERVPLERVQRHYPCVACPKLYRSAAKRDRHVRVHHPGAELMRAQTIASGSVTCAPAACPACPREYATRAKMLQHVRARHPHLVNKDKTTSH